MEVNPAVVAGVRIRYRLGTAEFSIALFVVYQLLLLNPSATRNGGALSYPGCGSGSTSAA